MPTRKGGKRREAKLSLKKGQVPYDNASLDSDHSQLIADSAHHLNRPEFHFTRTGDFAVDFPLLCRQHGMEVVPVITPRPQRPDPLSRKLSLPGRSSPSFSAGKKRGSLYPKNKTRKVSTSFTGRRLSPVLRTDSTSTIRLAPSQDRITEIPSEGGFRPTTFVIDSDKFRYFAPSIQVEDHQSNGCRDVRELYIRGWKVDEVMMGILRQCFVTMDGLGILHLWNVGLTAGTLGMLAAFLPRCHNLRTLLLDANPVGGGEANLAELISQHSPLQNLSLRFCGVDDHNAQALATALGTMTSWNQKLLTLNLSNNRITDLGAGYLARGLMTNRTLLVLDLACNQIGDQGAAALAEVLSHFPLDMAQLKHRRWVLSDKDPLPLEPLSNKSSQSDVMPKNEAKPKRREPPVSQDKKKKARDPSAGQLENKFLKDSRRISIRPHGDMASLKDRDSGVSNLKSKGKEPKANSSFSEIKKGQRKSRMPRKSTIFLEAAPLHVDWHPLAEPGQVGEDGEFRVVGNRSLISLNLSRNRIQEKGLRRLLEMVEAQANPRPELHHIRQQYPPYDIPAQQSPLGSQPPEVHADPPPYTSFLGLKRLVVHRNAVSADNPVLKKIQHLMLLRDPHYSRPLLTLHKEYVPPCAMPPITV